MKAKKRAQIDLDIVYITKTIRKLKAALCAVIGDDTGKIEKAKELFKDQACIHIHEEDKHECHHHAENNFFNFLMKYDIQEQ